MWNKIKEFYTKYINFKVRDIFYLVIIAGVIFFGWRALSGLNTQLESVHIEYKQLSDTLARAQNDLVTKQELQAFAKQLGLDLNSIKKDLNGLDAKLIAVGQVVATIDGKLIQDQTPDDQIDHDPPIQPDTCKLCDIYGYTTKKLGLDISLGEAPIGEVWFDASKATPFSTQYDTIDVKVDTAIGQQDDTDKHEGTMVFYHTISLVNKSRIDLAGKEFKLKTTSSEFKQLLEKTSQFYWWAPHLDIGIDNSFAPTSETIYNPGASLGFSIMGYGQTKNDLSWKFIRLGAGVNLESQFYLTLAPVAYNIGQFIPLISDLWISIGPTWSIDNQWGISISLSTTL